MLPESDAIQRYGTRLAVASLAAFERRVDAEGKVEVRIIHGGTNGVDGNLDVKEAHWMVAIRLEDARRMATPGMPGARRRWDLLEHQEHIRYVISGLLVGPSRGGSAPDSAMHRMIAPCGPCHGALFRVDAKAEGKAVAVGGWSPVVDGSGRVRPDLSRWFSTKLMRKGSP